LNSQDMGRFFPEPLDISGYIWNYHELSGYIGIISIIVTIVK
jgi:hypothetical protein